MRTSVRAVAAIAATQIRRVTRDRTSLFFSLALPVTIIVLIGSTQGGEDLDVGVADLDGSARSEELAAALEGTAGFDVERYGSLDDLRRDVRNGAVAAGVVVPGGYGAELDRGGRSTVELVADLTSSGAVVVQTSVRSAVATEAQRVAAARFLVDHGGGSYEESAAAIDDLAPTVAATQVERVRVGGDAEVEIFGFDYTTPANLVLFVFVNTLMAGALLAVERQQGITRRMLATPHGTGTILAGVALARLAFALGQSAVIVVVGALLFDIDWGHPLGAAALIVLFAVVAAAVGLVVGASVSNPEQAQAIGVPVAIGMGMLGGCMWPLSIVPEPMRIAGHLTPHAWAMDAWIQLVYHDAGLSDIALELGVLAAIAALVSLLAIRRLRVALTA